jgi:hypothetical protein
VILLGYVAWIGPAYWPVSADLAYRILAEESIELIAIFAYAARGMWQVWRVRR